MTRDISFNTGFDGFDDYREVPRSNGGLANRTIHLFFETRNSAPDTFTVRMHGDAVPYDGNGEWRGTMRRKPSEIAAAVQTALSCWFDGVVRYRIPETRNSYYYESLPVESFGAATAQELLRPVGLKLAKAGHKLLQFLFTEGDDGLKRLWESLKGALRQGEQIITVHSADVFIPWGMLYLPPDPATKLNGKDAKWEPGGFLGYTHLIEHSTGHAEGYHHVINKDGDVLRSGLHFDTRIQKPGETPAIIDTVQGLMERHSDVALRTSKVEVEEAFCDPGVNEHVLFFAAHGSALTFDANGPVEARVVLSDDEPIRSSDFEYWRSERSERMASPLCFMMVCAGGRATPALHEGLGLALLNLGVGCLVGPQIDIPRKFASDYACRFFEAFFTPGTRVAPVARKLARHYLDEQATPLGLAFTLLRGLDNHIAVDPAEAESVPAEVAATQAVPEKAVPEKAVPAKAGNL
ncbi:MULTISPECIES: hypothetical protein [unclassified Streptomyces]|uniref:hypothetical protein n=1 Tax=unclassified Streptomyces TaxID=2593676 RepID=UPI00081F6933|nr:MULTISPECIES: hypothetical protein [unclassified Streptomyces]MYZ38776.1 hypothetical protein [Streptomyces sp. SID4917]SCG00314.1 hypothetical protein GA0115259_106922 [Streptomyces sp. MnatMP-M17]